MGDEQLRATGNEAAAPPSQVKFWQTLPGILTAAGTFLAGLTGLVAIFFGHREVDSKPPPASSDLYIAARAPDGFVVMRTQPTANSPEISRISTGEAVHCGHSHPNPSGKPWRKCKDDEGNVGYMSDFYLQKHE